MEIADAIDCSILEEKKLLKKSTCCFDCGQHMAFFIEFKAQVKSTWTCRFQVEKFWKHFFNKRSKTLWCEFSNCVAKIPSKSHWRDHFVGRFYFRRWSQQIVDANRSFGVQTNKFRSKINLLISMFKQLYSGDTNGLLLFYLKWFLLKSATGIRFSISKCFFSYLERRQIVNWADKTNRWC